MRTVKIYDSNIKGFRVWSKKEKRMYYSDFIIDTAGNLYKVDDSLKMELVLQSDYIIMQKLDRTDITNNYIYEEDIIRYAGGNEFTVIFGTHPAYCHGDQRLTTNEGFCAAVYKGGSTLTNDTYPLSNVEKLAIIVGNRFQGYYKMAE